MTQINSSNGSTVCVLEVDLEYPKDLHKLHNEYHLASEREMLPSYQWKTADF